MATYRALLCDLDGTLADTEPQHCAAWLELLAETYRLDYDEQWFEQWIGTSDRKVAAWLIDRHGLSASVDRLIGEKQTRFHAAVRRAGRGFPGVARELQLIGERYPLAIATNSGRADAAVVVPALGLDRYTDVIVTATDVDHLKPAPDIYRLAAERLGVPPEQCIAIEDSQPGGVAAKAAGCFLIGLNATVDVADEHIPDNADALARARALLSAAPAD